MLSYSSNSITLNDPHICIFQPEEFRQQVEQYIIQSEESAEELQYWPIVKLVRLKIPNCDVCSSGAVLVDLPGVRDFNAARENVTKEVQFVLDLPKSVHWFLF